MVGVVPAEPTTFVRLRTKTSMDDLDQAYVTPPRKSSDNSSPSTTSAGTSRGSFLGFYV